MTQENAETQENADLSPGTLYNAGFADSTRIVLENCQGGILVLSCNVQLIRRVRWAQRTVVWELR